MREWHLDAERPPAVELDPERIAVVASYAEEPRVSRSLDALITQLREAHYQPILVRASPDERPLEWPGDEPDGVIVLRRPNTGYDFGSWADALRTLPGILGAEQVILANDSLVGPFTSMRALVDHFESREADAWGAVSNPQFFPHLQTFLLGFPGETLRARPLRAFWSSIRPQPTKMDYVMRYELGLSRLLIGEGFVIESMFPVGSLGVGHENPTLSRAAELMYRGFPFVKRSLLTADPDGEFAAPAARARDVAREVYGVDVEEWM